MKRNPGSRIRSAPYRPARIGFRLLFVAACAAATVSAHAQSSTGYVLSTSAWVADAPTKVAMGMEAFEDIADARIDVVRTQSGLQSLGQLLAGAADFATVSTTPVALHACRVHAGVVERGEVQPVVLASMALSNDTHFVIANGARGIDRPADLAGRRVGTMFDTSAHLGWHHFARLHGLLDTGIELVDFRVDRLAEALLDGAIDAAVIWAPWQRPVVDAWGDDARRFGIRAVNSVNWLLVGRRELVAGKPDLATGVVDAYKRAVELLNNDPVRARRLHARFGRDELPDPNGPAVGVIWDLGLDWSLLANLETNIEWCEYRLGRRLNVPIGRLIEPGPLRRVEPGAVMLPDGLFETRSGGEVGR